MEETLGKRIAANRKRLGWTQDQVAERLGITAQAVSKWENDQSCPDITMLPRLAEIFGTTTDALLGRAPEPSKPLFEAEVVEEPAGEEERKTGPKGSWTFQWDSGRREGITFAILILLVGSLLLAARIMDWDVGFWEILWPGALLVYGLREVFTRFSAFKLGVALVGSYFLVINLGIWQLDLDSALIFPILVVLFGLGLLFDAMKKSKKPRFKVVHHGPSGEETHSRTSKTQIYYSTEDGAFECTTCFGECRRVVALPLLTGGDVTCAFGDLELDLSGCEAVAPDCTIEATCSFGQLWLLVPKKYRIVTESTTAFGNYQEEGSPDPDPVATIALDGSASFGEITVKYI